MVTSDWPSLTNGSPPFCIWTWLIDKSTPVSLAEEPYSIRIVVFAGGLGGGLPAWAVQLASITKINGEVSRLYNSKSEVPTNSMLSPAAISPENSKESKLLSSWIIVYLKLTVASLLDETQALPDQSPEIFELTSNDPVLHLPISLKTPCWSCSFEATTTDSTFEPEGESIDKRPSGSPDMYNGTEAKVSPWAPLPKNNNKNANDRNIPIFFIFITLIFDAVIPNLVAYIM